VVAVVVVVMDRRHLAGIMVFVVHIFVFFICICRRDAGAPLIFCKSTNFFRHGSVTIAGERIF